MYSASPWTSTRLQAPWGWGLCFVLFPSLQHGAWHLVGTTAEWLNTEFQERMEKVGASELPVFHLSSHRLLSLPSNHHIRYETHSGVGSRSRRGTNKPTRASDRQNAPCKVTRQHSGTLFKHRDSETCYG